MKDLEEDMEIFDTFQSTLDGKRVEEVEEPKLLINELVKALPHTKEYQEIKIPKKKRGYRTISIPSPELKKIQRKILNLILKRIWPDSCPYIHGLHRGSYVEHAKVHNNAQWIFQFDIKDAFPSVDISALREILHYRFNREIEEFQSLIRHYKTSLEEIETGIAEEYRRSFFFSPFYRIIGTRNPRSAPQLGLKLTNLIIELTTFKDGLPQGAPTSPFLFYLLLIERGIVEKIWLNCPSGYNVSCYIDGFVVSGNKPIPLDFQKEMFEAIEEIGLKINKKKTRHQNCIYGAPMITGLRVNNDGEIRLSKKTVRKWRGIIHRAIYDDDPKLREGIHGFITSLQPIYGERKLPPQLSIPYKHFLEAC